MHFRTSSSTCTTLTRRNTHNMSHPTIQVQGKTAPAVGLAIVLVSFTTNVVCEVLSFQNQGCVSFFLFYNTYKLYSSLKKNMCLLLSSLDILYSTLENSPCCNLCITLFSNNRHMLALFIL